MCDWCEGGQGTSLFGQSGKVIAVNFGVFTKSTAANVAVPVSFAVELLKKAGWISPEEAQNQANQQNQTAAANTSSPPNKGNP